MLRSIQYQEAAQRKTMQMTCWNRQVESLAAVVIALPSFPRCAYEAISVTRAREESVCWLAIESVRCLKIEVNGYRV